MKVAIVGADGMLGREMVQVLKQADRHVVGFSSSDLNVTNPTGMEVLGQFDYVVNCAGLRPERCSDMMLACLVNAQGPRLIAKYSNYVYHVSTDCVFSGQLTNRKAYKVTDIPYPLSVYGMSKALGELPATNVCNIRTSFVGFDHGLLRWAIDNREKTIQGYVNTRWSGSYVKCVARSIAKMIGRLHANVVHLATPFAVSKYDVLCMLSEVLDLHLRVECNENERYNRSLEPTVELTPFVESAYEIANDFRSNDHLRSGG